MNDNMEIEMSNDTPEITPTPTPWFKRKRFVIPAALLGVAIVIGCTSGPTKPVKPATPNATSGPTRPAPPADPPAPRYDTPTTNDFRIGVKIMSKHCFGDVGCNVEVKTTLTNASGVVLDPGITYDLTYELLGDESGPMIDSMEIHGDQYNGGGTKFLSTPSSGTKITARITSIEEG